MKTFKICKKTNEVINTTPLVIEKLVTSGDDLCLVVEKDQAIGLNVGSKLHFEKQGEGNNGLMYKVCEEDTVVKAIVEEGDKKYIYVDYVYIKPLKIASFNYLESSEYKYKFYFTEDHNMLPCDLAGGYKIYVRRGGEVIEYSGLALCFPYELEKGSTRIPEGDGCTSQVGRYFNYSTMERNSILAKTSETISGDGFTPLEGDEVIFSTNPYFHIKENGEVTLYGSCPGAMKESVTISKYTDFMGLNIVLEDDYDAKRMFQEYQVNEKFVKKIKSSIVPGFIDLEKIKYAPAYSESGDTYLATGLTFNLHFRSRVMSDKPGEEYIFENTWHLNDGTETWNGNGIEDPGKTRAELYGDEEFVNTSNLIGYLGFTDDDIYNQKNRVKQSFLRLSFYDSDNPLTQNLLYYSTIFLDSGDLYGKYVKRKAWLEEMDDEYDAALNPVVWSSAATTDPVPAVTSQLIVNDEYDMKRSGEGFNLYLFKADAPIENSPQPIYMKVEFNHAGYGRTVPLICWKKNGEMPVRLTTANYLENLYVPLTINLTDKGYVYSFNGTKTERDNGIVWENERLVLNLFEPRIEPEN